MAKQKKEEKKENLVREKPVQVYFSDSEVEQIDKYRILEGVTKSQFIRTAVQDKIRKIEHPELFESKGISTNDRSYLKEVLKELFRDQTEKIELLSEKVELVAETMKSFEIIGKRIKKSEETELKEIGKKMITILKNNKQLTLEEISEALENQYNDDTLLKAIQREPKITMAITGKGGFKLK